jgi:hypothetical protein
MTRNRDDTYIRIPHAIESEPFYGDNDLLATWIRLFLAADVAYPFLPPVPRIEQSLVDALAAAGWIELAPNDRYSIPGMAEQRQKLTTAGKIGGMASVKSPLHVIPRTNRSTNRSASTNGSSNASRTYADADANVDVDEKNVDRGEASSSSTALTSATTSDFFDGKESTHPPAAASLDLEDDEGFNRAFSKVAQP